MRFWAGSWVSHFLHIGRANEKLKGPLFFAKPKYLVSNEGKGERGLASLSTELSYWVEFQTPFLSSDVSVNN